MNEESKLIELFKKYPGIAARIPRTNMITSLIAGQEMTNTNISMTTTRTNTQSTTTN